MSYYIHGIKGRIRIRTPHIKRNQVNANKVIELLNTINGIESVTENIVTGSLIINYDARVICENTIIDILVEFGCFDKEKALTADEYIQLKASSAANAIRKQAFGYAIDSALGGSTALSLITALI